MIKLFNSTDKLFTSNSYLVYYALATPEYILLNNTLQEQLDNIHEKLLSYKDTTNVSQINEDLLDDEE